ncbi:MAG: EAL domain-containing protein [Candidatus Saccharibacteria bacterium]
MSETDPKPLKGRFLRGNPELSVKTETIFILYDWDTEADQISWDPNVPDVFGYLPEEISTIDAFERLVHPKDLAVFREMIEKSLVSKSAYSMEYRVKSKSGGMVHVKDQGRYFSTGGNARLTGFLSDITDKVRLEKQITSVNRKLTDILENISDGFLAIDRDRRFTYVNNRAAQMLRKSQEEMIGKKIEDVYPALKELKGFDRQAGEMEPVAFDEHYPDLNSWYHFRVNPTEDGWVVYFQDITKSKQSAVELEQSRQRLELAQKAGNIGTFEWDLDSGKIFWTPELEALYGIPKGSFDGTYEAWQKLVHPDDAAAVHRKITASVENKKPELDIEFRIIRPNGSIRWLKSKGRVYFGEGRTPKVIGINMDVTEQKQYEERIRYHVFNDPLTGLPNRLMFYERMREVMERTGQERGSVTSVIIIDLDRFKNINDSLGHSAGDRVIQEVALRFQAALKERGLLARLGGDEFVIMMDKMEHEEEPAQVARDVLECLRVPVVFDGKELYSSASIGISLYPSDGEDTSTLLKNADAALYRAKEQGRNNFQFYAPSMNSLAFQKLTLENSMRRALTNLEFLVYYQPQIDLESGKIVQVEALVRWMHPDFGLIFPEEFIDLAETNGLIEPIGEMVLRMACAQMNEWDRLGLKKLRLSVNMSARQFRRKHLVKMVRKILDETKFDPHRLELELTESVLVEDFGNTLNSMWELKRDGIKFSLDDFNTRYSSLNYIKRFPIDILKIDRSFVKGIPGNEKDSAIANSIINLAQTLNYSVVAEGVEREDQLRFLKNRRCDRAQGYLFSPPSPPDTLVGTLLRGEVTSGSLERKRPQRKNP